MVWSPDPVIPSSMIRRSDVLLHYGAADDKTPIALFKAKPVSTSTPQTSKRYQSSILDALGSLLSFKSINPDEQTKVSEGRQNN